MNLGIETETLEFKKSTGELKEAMHSICAILNKHQYGELYFGVKTDGTVIGQVVTEESLREVSQKIKNLLIWQKTILRAIFIGGLNLPEHYSEQKYLRFQLMQFEKRY